MSVIKSGKDIIPRKEQKKQEGDPSGHIYLLMEREFINAGEPIYKIGYSQQVQRRIASYPKGSRVHLLIHVPDCKEFERRALMLFRAKFQPCLDIGREFAYMIWNRKCTVLIHL